MFCLGKENVRTISLIGGTVAALIGLFLLGLGLRGLFYTEQILDSAKLTSKSSIEFASKNMLFLGIVNAVAGAGIIFSNFMNNDSSKS